MFICPLSLSTTSAFSMDGLATEPELRFGLRGLQLKVPQLRTHTCSCRDEETRTPATSYSLPACQLNSYKLWPWAGRRHTEPEWVSLICGWIKASRICSACVYFVYLEHLVPQVSYIFLYHWYLVHRYFMNILYHINMSHLSARSIHVKYTHAIVSTCFMRFIYLIFFFFPFAE